ncbi:hypothetical protein [Marinicellulosiphila megalodicopiae]|uniref:hypothetical protein n=1 Tax=Marinicellulosiphila megalodicopiae TaxID=2724896 RepID=UPI003BB20915
MSIYTIILILFTILLIIFYYKYPAPKRLTLEEKIAKIKQGQEDAKQRAFEKMPRFGYYIYHIAPIGSPLDEGLIDMTNTLEDLKITLFKSLSEGTHHNETLQKAWNNNEFNQDDFYILYFIFYILYFI